jgi:hypothetical protein
MLSPGGMGRPSPYNQRGRRRRRRILRALASVTVLCVLAAGAWYFFLRDAKAKPKAASSAPCRTASPSPQPSATVVALTPKQVTINVYNATKRQGLARRTAVELRKRGFVIGKVGNDPLKHVIPGAAEVRAAAHGTARAKLVAVYVDKATVTTDRRAEATVDLVLGNTFAALRTPAQVATALHPPTPAPTCGPPGATGPPRR